MVISMTTSRVTPEQERQIDGFLQEFLPKLQREPGVVAVYHYYRPDPGESTTLIVWENDAARQAYRQSPLFEQPMAMEARLGMSSAREAYPLNFASQR